MAKFDLKGMLSERSTQEIDLPEQKTVYRNPEDLIPSKDNFYSTEDTEKLKQSIRALGILQPLLIEERDGKDYLLAGHRRRKCCLELIKEGLERFKRIPCVYKPKIELSAETETDEIVRKMVIIQSNTYREKTDWEKMTESLQMEELVKELREKTDLEGKTREIVSDLIGVSSTQIGRYHSISSNLSGELMDAFKQNKLNVSTAAELAGLNEKYQNEACKLLLEVGQVTLNAAKLLKAQQEQERDIPGQMTIDQALHPHKPEEIKGRTLNTSYRYLASQARLMYDPFSPEFDDSEERCQLAAGLQDEKQQSDIAESARTEECPTGNNEIPKYIVDFAPIIQGNWPEFLKDIPVPTDTELTCYLYDQEKDLKKMVEIEKEEGLPHMMIMRQRMVVAGLRLLKKMIENMENEK